MITVHSEAQYAILSEYAREHLALDAEAGVLYWKKAPKYHPEVIGKAAGHLRATRSNQHDPRYYMKLRGIAIARARVVFFLYYGYWAKPSVDHINRNQLDDRPANLREASHELNNHNHSRRNIRETSGGHYQARLAQKVIGTYQTLEEAERAYDKARTMEWGT